MSQYADDCQWSFRLYINGQSLRSTTAIANLRRICEEHLAGRYEIDVIDLIEEPHLAERDQIIAIPTVMRRSPAPMRRVIGDLSDDAQTLNALEIGPCR